MQPLYHIQKSFQENLEHPISLDLPKILTDSISRKHSLQKRFLGYTLASPIGVAACAVTTGKGIAQLATLGFDVLTYKTIRSHPQPSHVMPNIVYLAPDQAYLTESDLALSVRTCSHPPNEAKHISISNSLGNPSMEPAYTQRDIAYAKQALVAGQVLICSVYGDTYSKRSLSADFAYTAQLAEEAGADVIELNLSCPNVLEDGAPLTQSVPSVFEITRAVVRAVRVPVIAKIALLMQRSQIEAILIALARAGAQGVSAINAISMQVVDETGTAIFPGREKSGVSGNIIRPLALKFIEQLAEFNQQQRLELSLLGMGGITQAAHFAEFLRAGAQVALSATGMMWNPYLAAQYHQSLQEAK